MTTPPPVLLVLAWDDADPAVHRVAATGALPARPTLPLVRTLAAGQPVLALLPETPPNGVESPAPALNAGSRLVGLSDFMVDALAGAGPATAREGNAPPSAGSPARPVQLRPSPAQRAAGWQLPAAPYTGSAENPAGALLPTAGSELPAAGAAGPEAAVPSAVAAPTAAELPSAPTPPLFDQPTGETGTAEAADLADDDAPESELPPPAAPVGPARATLTQGLAALHRPPAPDAEAPAPAAEAPAPAFSLSDDLHYRVIQYARFATYASDNDGEDVGVIYAPDWPTWLAALEIRYRRRRPLVLHLSLLAAESAAPAERGWLLELERYALRRAHTVLAVSDDLRAQVLKHYGLAPDRVRVVAADDADGVRAALAEIGGLKNVGNAGDVKM